MKLTSESDKPTVHLIVALAVLIIIFAGCSGFYDRDTTNPNGNETDLPQSEQPESNSTETTAPSTNEEVNTKSTPGLNKSRKYQAFKDAYVEGLRDYNVSVVNSSVNVENDTIHLTYTMKDPDDNITSFWERKNISLNYYYGYDYFISSNKTGVNKTWVPKRVNVSGITSDKKLYETGYVTYENATALASGEITDDRYVIRYYLSVEPGPANPHYQEGNQTEGSELANQSHFQRLPEHKRFLRPTPPNT